MTVAFGGTLAILTLVIGLGFGQNMISSRSARHPEPLSRADVDCVRQIIEDQGLVAGVKEVRRRRPDMSVREARITATHISV